MALLGVVDLGKHPLDDPGGWRIGYVGFGVLSLYAGVHGASPRSTI